MPNTRISQISSDLHLRRPPNTAFHQQRLSTWELTWKPRVIWPILTIFGIIGLLVGLVLLYVSYNTPEYTLDYTDCIATEDSAGRSCSDIIATTPGEVCHCEMTFTLDQAFPRRVFLYYGLRNFYQNHHYYTRSRDDRQLRGVLSNTPSERCEPFIYAYRGDRLLPIVPCGSLANSLFNDSFTLYALSDVAAPRVVPLVSGRSLWPHERAVKFRNPRGNLRQRLVNYARPPSWSRELWELDPDHPDNNGLQNEDLIVWMRPAALSNFRKLYRQVDDSKAPFQDGLPSGNYSLHIAYRYPVHSFDGRKSIILSSPSLLGARNHFHGLACIISGIICLVLACVLAALPCW
ncbi:cell cycle control protein 50A-like [Anopheles aquasalis]|uniref:cell cycle control protein 50A-like n=1 Tax=Anopheles aquasalis TaxID=42839 RepID=UPI00215AECFE|nr:cell cycle control protein 50A-like [Anopheles aquasalis]